MKTDETIKEECRVAASLIVDALVYVGIVNKKDIDRAFEIAEEEILVRKTMGKL